ncbi:MAG: FHA domain-containing protein [Kofleriaceae bacterium]|nr:FHA domain-containing protein [Kofleriaceae bacterium]
MSNFDPFDDETAVASAELQDAMKKQGRAHLVKRETLSPQPAANTPVVNEPPIAHHRNQAPLRLDDEISDDPPSTKRMVPMGKFGDVSGEAADEYTVEEQRPLGNKDLQKIADRIRLAATPADDPQRGFLTIQKGSDKGRRVGLPEGRTTIGRGTDNDIVLTDISVSRHHIVVERRDRIYYICDVGSGNGTEVNGRRREGEILIVNGDVFSIGNTEIAFEGPEVQHEDSLPTNTWDQPQGPNSSAPERLEDSEDEPTVLGKSPTKPRELADVAYEEPTNVVPSVEISPDIHLRESRVNNNVAPIHLDDEPAGQASQPRHASQSRQSSEHEAQEAAIDAIASIINTPEPEILSMHTILPDDLVIQSESEVELFSSAPPIKRTPEPPSNPLPPNMGAPMPELPKPAPLASFKDAPAPLLSGNPPGINSAAGAGQWPTPGHDPNPGAANPPVGAPQNRAATVNAPMGMQNSGPMGAPQNSGPMGASPNGPMGAPQNSTSLGMQPMGMQNSGPMGAPQNSTSLGMQPMGMQNSGPMGMQNPGMPPAGMQSPGPMGMPSMPGAGGIPSYDSISSPMLGGHTDQLRGRYAAKPKQKSNTGYIALIVLALVLVAGGIIAAVNKQAGDTDTVATTKPSDKESVVDPENSTESKDKDGDGDVKEPALATTDKQTAEAKNGQTTEAKEEAKPAEAKEEAKPAGIASLIARNTTLPVSTWGNDESFITDISVTIPDTIPVAPKTIKPPIKTTVRTPKKVVKAAVRNNTKRNDTKRNNTKRNDSPASGKTSAIKAAARSLYKRQQFADAADKLEDAADDFGDSDADALFALADKYRAIGNLLNKAKSSNPTAGLTALKKALKKDRSVGGALSKLIHLRIGKIAPKAASAYMQKKNYTMAKSAADDAKRENAGAAVARILSSLERKASSNVKKAKRAKKSGDRNEAKQLLREAIKLAPKGSAAANDARDMLRKL